MQTIVSLVSAGIGVALVPESVRTFSREHLAFRRLRGSSATLRLALRPPSRQAVAAGAAVPGDGNARMTC